MTSNKLNNFHFTIYPSRWFMGMLLILHTAALTVLLNLPLQWWAKLLIALILFASLLVNILRHITRRFKSCPVACRLDQGQWFLTLRNNEEVPVSLPGESVATQFLVIMRFKSPGCSYCLILFRDALAAHNWLQLQRFLHS